MGRASSGFAGNCFAMNLFEVFRTFRTAKAGRRADGGSSGCTLCGYYSINLIGVFRTFREAKGGRCADEGNSGCTLCVHYSIIYTNYQIENIPKEAL